MNFTFSIAERKWSCHLADEQIVWQMTGPSAAEDWRECLQQALSHPLDYPPLIQAVIPDDRVVIVVEQETPCWIEIVNLVGKQFLESGVEETAILIVLNSPADESQLREWQKSIPFRLSTSEELLSEKKAYLASSAEGERIYLPAEIIDADFVMTVGLFGFDEAWGYRGTHSLIYPGLLQQEAKQQVKIQSSAELKPESSHGIRQQIDEIGWLLGVQYSLQVIPSHTGEIAHLIGGASDSVFRRGTELLNDCWRAEVTAQADTAVVCMTDHRTADNWASFRRTCLSAERIVKMEGQVVLLANPGELDRKMIELIEQAGSEEVLYRRLKKRNTEQAAAVRALLQLATRYKVYLYSSLASAVAESLHCIPLESPQEVQSLVEGEGTFAVLCGAQYAYIDH